MFEASADKVKNSLKGLIKIVEEQLSDKTDEIFVSVRRDYRAVLGAGESQEGQMLPRPQRLCRKEIKGVIEGVRRIFEKVVNGELDDDGSQTGDVGDEKDEDEGNERDPDESDSETNPDRGADEASGIQSDDPEKSGGENESGKEDGLMADAASLDPTESKGEDGEGVGRDVKMTAGDSEASDAEIPVKTGDGIAATGSPSNQLSSQPEHPDDATVAYESANSEL